MSDRTDGFAHEYFTALEGYLRAGHESALTRAYELGRRAMADGLGVLDMAVLHRGAVDVLVVSAPARDQPQFARAWRTSSTSCSRRSRCRFGATARRTR